MFVQVEETAPAGEREAIEVVLDKGGQWMIRQLRLLEAAGVQVRRGAVIKAATKVAGAQRWRARRLLGVGPKERAISGVRTRTPPPRAELRARKTSRHPVRRAEFTLRGSVDSAVGSE